jgi:type I restriction-modification system DNA methylase subunit
VKRGNIRDLHRGREAWKHIEKIAYGRSIERVFEDWLDLMLAAYLSITDNFSRPYFIEKLKAQKLDGIFEDRYMEIVKRYADKAPKGDRAIDHFQLATAELVKETTATSEDVLGEIFMAMITFGEHGQYFTPMHLVTAMVDMTPITAGQSVLDPACGSGRFLIEAGKKHNDLKLTGYDLDPRCAKMCALNMYMFNFEAHVKLGNTLTMEFYTEWHIGKGGFIFEKDVSKKAATAPVPKRQQEQLFAA